MDNESRLKPGSAAERQAVITLDSAGEVLAEIDHFKKILLKHTLVPVERREAQQGLMEASERLCNLMALAVHELADKTSAEFQQQYGVALSELRTRLVGMGVNLMIDKLENIHRRASDSLKHQGAYPVGLAPMLRQRFGEILTNLQNLGAGEKLDGELKDLIDDVRGLLKRLEKIEHQIGMLREIPKAEPRRRNQPAAE